MKQQPDLKKYDWKTLYELLMITSTDIAYPPDAPANTSDKNPPENQKKYEIWDYRNLTDNQGWIPIKIDYKSFKPRKFYKDASQAELQNHLQAIKRKQELLKQFKFSQDFDRLDYLESPLSNTYQNHIEKIVFGHFVFSLIFSRIMTVMIYDHKFSFTLWRNKFKQIYFYSIPVAFFFSLSNQYMNPANHEYFRSLPRSMRMYQTMAHDADAFKYNNDIKYNFKYPEKEEFDKLVEKGAKMKMDTIYKDSVEEFKKVYGVVEREPFWDIRKMSQGKNQMNKAKQAI